jgi:thiol-disulfide isomerase/thioredoxin
MVAAATVAVAAWPRKPQARPQDVAELVPMDPPQPPPDASFVAEDRTEHKLSDFRGRGMVVNLWATWCVPCVAEMPALAKLAASVAPFDIAVLPLSSDRGGIEVVQSFYRQHGITGLPALLDPRGQLARAWGARGIPTTFIIDKQGKVVARLEGAADWSAPQVVDLVRKLAG